MTMKMEVSLSSAPWGLAISWCSQPCLSIMWHMMWRFMLFMSKLEDSSGRMCEEESESVKHWQPKKGILVPCLIKQKSKDTLPTNIILDILRFICYAPLHAFHWSYKPLHVRCFTFEYLSKSVVSSSLSLLFFIVHILLFLEISFLAYFSEVFWFNSDFILCRLYCHS